MSLIRPAGYHLHAPLDPKQVIKQQPFYRAERELQLIRLKRNRAEVARQLSRLNMEIAKLS